MRILKPENIIVAIFLCTILLISGCQSKKTVASGGTGTVSAKSQSEVLANVNQSGVEYNTISAKGNIGYGINGSGKKVSAVYKILKDSMMQVSVRFLGIEGARITITTDSIFAINRLNKQYIAESLSSVQDKIGFNYYNLQSLLTNKIFIPGRRSVTDIDAEAFKMLPATETYILQARGNNRLLYNFSINGSGHVVSTCAFTEGDEGNAIEWAYSDFIKDPDNGYTYPTSMVAKMKLKDKLLNMNISFSKLNIDEKGFEINNKISSNYKRKTIKEFIAALP